MYSGPRSMGWLQDPEARGHKAPRDPRRPTEGPQIESKIGEVYAPKMGSNISLIFGLDWFAFGAISVQK